MRETSDRNIVLTGFMGIGKTSVGKLIAEKTGRAFIDTDDLIEQRAGKSIPRIFAEEGESAFRDLETEAVQRAAQMQARVIATGGGAVMRPQNRKALRATGDVVFLDAEPEVILQRIRNDGTRPLLQTENPLERARALLKERRPVYLQADLTIQTGRLTPEQTADAILEALQNAPRARRVEVNLGERSYAIHIGRGTLSRLPELLDFAPKGAKIAVCANAQIQRLYGNALVDSLNAAGYDAWTADLPDGEQHKTLQAAADLLDQFVENRMGRDSFVAALGGGVAGDIAGFAAAVYMRGVPFIQMPTSLIAQVDSSVGGKTAVDHPKGKNLIGAFHQPKLVLIDVETLKTLPAREYAAGVAEVMRYGVIASEGLFHTLETRMADILRRDSFLMTQIAAECCAIKARIVEQDERESGVRATLNYGHTFGHALETITGYKRFLHGEAVSVGMVCAAEMSAARGLVGREFCNRHRALLRSAGLPSKMPSDIDPMEMVDAMKMDKKAVVSPQGVRLRFIVSRKIGSAEIRGDFTEKEAEAAIEAAKR
ncbi:MAG: 3-dehydroquinate synthase [Candidatus Poribacteria bacterium]|nr:3-dehydroquinate synthase [Candidatus Poribacteria bacterium]